MHIHIKDRHAVLMIESTFLWGGVKMASFLQMHRMT